MDAETGLKSGTQQEHERRAPVAWHDLREWIAEVDRIGELKRISAPVDPNEEIGAITLMAAREEKSPALLFDNMQGDATHSHILTNMLGASKERYALAVGLDPSLSTLEMIEATRAIMADPIEPVMIAKDKAPVNEVVLTGINIDVTKFPVPKFWPGDGGQFIGTGDITFTSSPDTGRINVGCYRQMLHGPNRIGLYCSPGKHGLLDREAWWARGEPCEVVAAYGIDPVMFMLAAQIFRRRRIRTRCRGRHHGPSDRIDEGGVCQPADPGACRIRGRRHPAQGRHAAGRPARRIHRLLRARTLAAAGDGDQGGASPQDRRSSRMR